MTYYLTIAQATNRAAEYGINVSTDTIRYWASRKGMGRKIFGAWRIDADAFERHLTGEEDGPGPGSQKGQ
jgi:hypothetical protein